MSEWVYVRDLAHYDGQIVTIKGWVYNRTDKGKLQFILVRDGTGVVQCVAFQKECAPEVFADVLRLTQESAVIVTGQVRLEKRAPGGAELSLAGLELVQLTQDYPITPKEHGVAFLMENRHLWLRSSQQAAILRIRAEVIRAIRDWLDSHGFINVDTPILTPSSCEDTTTLFETDYFGAKAYLTQSGQLYNEATAAALGKVYCFGPTFRAEKSKTRRHLTEFWMVEPEMSYVDLPGCMEVEEQFVSHIVQTVLKNRAEDLKTLGRDVSRLEKVLPPFPRITYDEAVERLNQAGVPMQWGDDFGAPHETAIGEQFDRPVFVYNYPTAFKAFYMEVHPERPEVCLSVDLIASEGYGEIIGGGQRTSSYELLLKRIEEHHLPRQDYEWYLDLRRYGSVSHSGFGLGVERTVSWICGIEHIRETIAFPRMLERIYP